MRIAIIDLGTNTFNLLIARVYPDRSFSINHSGKLPAKIGEGGINRYIITPEAMNRAITVLKNFITVIKNYGGVDKIVAIATSAVRTATNKAEFVTVIKESTGIDIHIISGDDEAAYIYEGVKQTITIMDETTITLDIGGGSNEFIIANGDDIYWKHSFPLGIARILDIFYPENPIMPGTIRKIERYFENELGLLWNETVKYNIKTLLGSSGSFDTYRLLLTQNKRDDKLYYTIPVNEYYALHKQLVESTTEERLRMKGMETMRVEMIVLASVFTNYVVKKLGIQSIIQSDYSLKEGVLALLANNRFTEAL